MPARKIHVCPKCSKRVPQRNYRSAAGLRYHRDCLTDAEQIALSRVLPRPRGRGRPPLAKGAGSTALLRVRCKEGQKARWIESAGGEGALSAWVCAALDAAVGA